MKFILKVLLRSVLFGSVCFFLFNAPHSFAAPIQRPELRELAKMPSLNLEVGFGFKTEVNFDSELGDVPLDEVDETQIRRSLELHPSDSAYWQRLGIYLFHQGIRSIVPQDAPNKMGQVDFGQIVLHLSQFKGSKEEYQGVMDRMKEAESALTRSVEIDPSHSNAYFYRALAKWSLLASKSIQSGEGSDAERMQNAMVQLLNEDVLSDMRSVARLAPSNLDILTTVGNWELVKVAMEKGLAFGEIRLPEISAKGRESIQFILDRLEACSQTENDHFASQALIGLGTMHLFIGKMEEVYKYASGAYQKNPESEEAWTLTLMTLVSLENYHRIKELGLERLKTHRTADNHLIVAKALEYLKQWDDMKFHILSAYALDRKDPKVHLARAAAYIRTVERTEDLESVQSSIIKAFEILNEKSEAPNNREEFSNSNVALLKLAAICDGLTGNEEQARQVIDQVFTISPEDKDAKEILRILRGPGN